MPRSASIWFFMVFCEAPADKTDVESAQVGPCWVQTWVQSGTVKVLDNAAYPSPSTALAGATPVSRPAPGLPESRACNREASGPVLLVTVPVGIRPPRLRCRHDRVGFPLSGCPTHRDRRGAARGAAPGWLRSFAGETPGFAGRAKPGAPTLTRLHGACGTGSRVKARYRE